MLTFYFSTWRSTLAPTLSSSETLISVKYTGKEMSSFDVALFPCTYFCSKFSFSPSENVSSVLCFPMKNKFYSSASYIPCRWRFFLLPFSQWLPETLWLLFPCFLSVCFNSLLRGQSYALLFSIYLWLYSVYRRCSIIHVTLRQIRYVLRIPIVQVLWVFWRASPQHFSIHLCKKGNTMRKYISNCIYWAKKWFLPNEQ